MNINRDYLIINDVKKSNIKLDNGSMFFYITDKNTQNIFVNLVINVSNNDLIQKYANIENAEDYTLTMNIVKPDNTYKIVEGKLHDKEKAIFEFNLNEDCCDEIGTYRCELLTKCNINDHEEITTSNKLTYKVKSSVLNDLDDIVEAPEYPLVIQLFGKLSDINQYEEDRRANELARQLAEEQRQTRFNTLDADMVDRVNAMDDKMDDVEARISAKEQAVDKLIVDTKVDIDDYKVAKDTEIDEYKTAKDQQIDQAIADQNNTINQAITNQNNKIDTTVAEQNNRIEIVEANDNTQNTRLDALEAKDIAHETSITNIEAKNVEQDNRLDSIEAFNVSQDNRLDAIEIKNQQQDDRLLDIEKVNSKQDIDIKCLYGASQTIDITKEGNSIYLQNSNNGFAVVDEICGNTMVNCNKEPDKEIILNGNINTQGYSNVTLTEGVDGGLVDIALEGNTMVNVCDQKDPVAITKSYTVETGNHVALQGGYDGKCRPVVTGNTLVNIIDSFGSVINAEADFSTGSYKCTANGTARHLYYKVIPKTSTTYTAIAYVNKNTINDKFSLIGLDVTENNSPITIPTGFTGLFVSKFTTKADNLDNIWETDLWKENTEGEIEIKGFMILEGDYTNKPIPSYFQGLQSSFEDKVVTQEMVDAGEELAENLGKYKVDYVISREDGTVGQTKTFYLNSPLLEGDTIEQQGDNVVHVHRYRKVVLDGSNYIPYTNGTAVSNKKRWALYHNPSVMDVPSSQINTINNKYPDVSAIDTFKAKEGVSQNSAGNTIHLYLEKYSDGSDTSKQALISELQQNPMELVYELASPTYEVVSTNDELLVDSYVNGHLDVDSVVPIEKVDFLHFEEELTYLYANTQYAVQFVSNAVSKIDITLGGAELLNQDVALGTNKYTITTPSELIDNNLVLNGEGFNASNIVVTEATDQDFGYFEGMKSVGECEDLEVVSSNSDSTLSNTQTLTHEPLRAVGDIKDKYVLIDGKWYIERNCGVRAYQEGDIDNYITDKINTVYPLSSPTYEPIDYNPFTVYSNTTHISNNSTIPCNMTIKNTGYNCLLKPSTTYTVSSNLGLNTVTTPSTLTEDCLRFYDTDTSTVTKMNNVMVLEGDYTTGKPIPSHFSGIESAFEQQYDEAVGKYKVKAKVVGKNLFDGTFSTGYIENNGTTSNAWKDLITKDYIPVIPGKSLYIFTTYTYFPSIHIHEYDKNKQYIKENSNGILSHNTHFVRIHIGGKYNVNGTTQLVVSYEPVTSYEPYKENYIEFYIHEPLRGIGDIKDKVYAKNDKVVVERNCGQREYQDGDFGTYLTDKVNTVYPLAEPIYEEVEYNDTKLFIESFKNSTLFYNSNVPVTSKLYYSYSVPLVDTVAQTANTTDQQDSMIIDLATQVAVMEMMLM